MYYPQYRPRRMRKTDTLRAMIRETHLRPEIFVYPLFVIHGEDVKNPVKSMPGVYQLSIRHLIEEAREVAALGIRSVLLFGIPDVKDEAATGAYDPEGVVQMAIRAIKEAVPQLTVIADVCLCEYMSHGHCGVVREDGCVDNDLSVELLAKTALSYAEAGVDVVAPSDMMDGRISAIRSTLDHEGHDDVAIFSYSTKYASSFYGPFRDAAESPPQFGDRKSYQMDPANTDEGVREAMMDIEEGADMIMVKPALPYLDLIYRIKSETRFPSGGLQRERRVRHGEGGGGQGLARREGGGLGDPAVDQARGCGHHHHLPRQGCRSLAGGRNVHAGVGRAPSGGTLNDGRTSDSRRRHLR